MKIVILERNSIGLDVSTDVFREFGEVVEYPNTVGVEQAAERMKDADIVIANKTKMNRDSLKDAKNVKLICLFATGYDNIDLEYCKERGIRAANVTNYCCPAVAQHTLLLGMMLAEKIAYYDDYVKSGAYQAQDRFSHFDRPFHDLEGKTWGIIGMGNIGKRVARMATGMGCKVIFYSASGKSTCTDYPQVNFDTILAESDFLSLHCPLSERTRYLINKEALGKMKSTAILINVARGPVVNTQDLYDALAEGRIAAAGLDVLEEEPIAADNPLNQIKDSTKLIITPHMSWASVESRNNVRDKVATNIRAFLNGTEDGTFVC